VLLETVSNGGTPQWTGQTESWTNLGESNESEGFGIARQWQREWCDLWEKDTPSWTRPCREPPCTAIPNRGRPDEFSELRESEQGEKEWTRWTSSKSNRERGGRRRPFRYPSVAAGGVDLGELRLGLRLRRWRRGRHIPVRRSARGGWLGSQVSRGGLESGGSSLCGAHGDCAESPWSEQTQMVAGVRDRRTGEAGNGTLFVCPRLQSLVAFSLLTSGSNGPTSYEGLWSNISFFPFLLFYISQRKQKENKIN
jgi:hypothetical protein